MMTLELLPEGSYQGVWIVPPKSNGGECMLLSPSKGKPPRPKPQLQKPLKDIGFDCKILSKTLSFWSKGSTLINLWWNPSKTLEKTYKYH